jgi:hypothetical protein
MALSDRVVVMNHGRAEQIGPPHEAYERPATPFVANFLGRTNLVNGATVRPEKIWFDELEEGMAVVIQRMVEADGGEVRWRGRVVDGTVSFDGGATPIDKAAPYRVAMNNFMADGGDNYTVFRLCTQPLGGDVDLDAFGGADIQVYKRLYLSLEGRFTWVHAELDQDFIDFEPIDLGGFPGMEQRAAHVAEPERRGRVGEHLADRAKVRERTRAIHERGAKVRAHVADADPATLAYVGSLASTVPESRWSLSSASILRIWWNMRHAVLYVTPNSRSNCLAEIPQCVEAILKIA